MGQVLMTGLGIPLGTLVDDRYRILRLLGNGAFGRTYLATDERRFGERCVLKEFRASDRFDLFYVSKRRELFRREATILHQLDHPQIPKFLAWFESAHRLFLVQEYVDGQTYWNLLKGRQRRGYAFTEVEVINWLKALLPVLAYIHDRKILHRDISPDNIMLPRGEVLPVLIDFGVVKQADTQLNLAHANSSELSIQASVAVGKFGYSPNEQLRMGQCSPSSDLYSLAVTAVVLLTGKSPSQLIHPETLEWKWRSLVSIDARFGRILSRMMAEKPQNRYPSAQAVMTDLSRLSQPQPFVQPAWNPLSGVQSPRLNAMVDSVKHHPHAKQLLNFSSTQAAIAHVKTLRQHAWRVGVVTLISAGALLGGLRLGFTSPFCEAFSTCINIQDYSDQYQQATEQGEAAQNLAQRASSLVTLQHARDRLHQATLKLSIIPQEADTYEQAQATLVQYQSTLNELDIRLERETQASSLLDRAESAARSATNLSQVAESLRDYKAARDQWNAALTLLQAIPENSLLADQVKQRSQDYRSQLDVMEELIAKQELSGSTTAKSSPLPMSVIPSTETHKQTSSLPLSSQAKPDGVSTQSQTPEQIPVNNRPSESPSGRSPVASPSSRSRSSAATPSSSIRWNRPSESRWDESGRVALTAAQAAGGVQISLDGAYINRSGSYVANLIIKNESDRPFGFVPLFARVQDTQGRDVQSRVSLSGTDELVRPGETLRGQVFILGRRWDDSGDQNLMFIINEGTSGGRLFQIRF
ncbi:MAG: protein kinase domain-containing protein [Elainellaceae cyanobacterium]